MIRDVVWRKLQLLRKPNEIYDANKTKAIESSANRLYTRSKNIEEREKNASPRLK